MLTTITILASVGWFAGILWDLLFPKVEDPRLHMVLAVISCMLLWERLAWLSCIIGFCETLYAVLVIIHYVERWKFIGHQARMKRESQDARLRDIFNEMSAS